MVCWCCCCCCCCCCVSSSPFRCCCGMFLIWFQFCLCIFMCRKYPYIQSQNVSHSLERRACNFWLPIFHRCCLYGLLYVQKQLIVSKISHCCASTAGKIPRTKKDETKRQRQTTKVYTLINSNLFWQDTLCFRKLREGMESLQ